MTESRQQVVPHGWADATDFPWIKQGFVDFETSFTTDIPHRVIWNYQSPADNVRCFNNLDVPISINEMRLAVTGAGTEVSDHNIFLPVLAARFGKTGYEMVQDWTPVTAMNHNWKLHSNGVAYPHDSIVVKLPCPYFLARGNSLKTRFRLRNARYGGPTALNANANLFGYNQSGQTGMIGGHIGAGAAEAAIPDNDIGIVATFDNTVGAVSGMHAQDMWLTHMSIGVYSATGLDVAEVDIAQYIEAKFEPSGGPQWTPSGEGWTSLLGMAAAPSHPMISIPFARPLILNSLEEFWMELMPYATLSRQSVADKVLASVWAIGTQKGIIT